MDPKIWGPNIWYTLHIISLYYPTNPTEFQKRAYHDFFINLKEVLPCSKCKDHYTKYVSEYPITPHLDSKKNVIKWLIDVHNFVNLSLNKPTFTYTEVLKLYKNLKPTHPFIPCQQNSESSSLNQFQFDTLQKQKNQLNYYGIYFVILILIIGIILMNYKFYVSYYDF